MCINILKLILISFFQIRYSPNLFTNENTPWGTYMAPGWEPMVFVSNPTRKHLVVEKFSFFPLISSCLQGGSDDHPVQHPCLQRRQALALDEALL